MNYTLHWKYFRRESLWIKWLPIYVLLIEIVVPLKLTLFVFLFLWNIFSKFNSMTPYTMKSIQMTHCRLVDCVKHNNLLLIIAATIIHLFVLSIVSLMIQLTKGTYDFRQMAEFIPLLLASVLIGNVNIFLRFSGFRISGILEHLMFFVFLLCTYLVSQYSLTLYLVSAISCMLDIFFTYKMLKRYD